MESTQPSAVRYVFAYIEQGGGRGGTHHGAVALSTRDTEVEENVKIGVLVATVNLHHVVHPCELLHHVVDDGSVRAGDHQIIHIDKDTALRSQRSHVSHWHRPV